MKVRSASSFALLFASAIAGTSVQAQSFQYAPGTARYKLTNENKMTQEAMGQKNDMEVKGEQVISVTVGKKASDTLSVDVVVDSISMTNSMMGAMDVSSAKGAKISSLISPLGVVYSTTVPDSGAAAELGDDLARMLPRISSNLRMGAAWSDTVSGKLKRSGIDMDRTVVANSKVVADTTINGEKAFKIERSTEVKMSGSGTAQGQPVSMEGTSTGTGFVYVSPTGTFVGADAKDDIKMKITLIANGMEVGLTMANTSKITKIK
jgi:hypothetical protein